MAASGLKLRSGTTSHSLAYKDLKRFLEDPASERHWDDLSRTTWFQLREGETLRTAWFDDARSLREKLKLVQLVSPARIRRLAAGRGRPGVLAAGRAVTADYRRGRDLFDTASSATCYLRYFLAANLFPGEKPCEPARLLVYRFLMFTTLAAGARGAEHTWVVYSAGELDERIERQLNVLAAQDQALIRILEKHFGTVASGSRGRRPGD